MVQIKWVNHASFVIESADTKLLIDPWLKGLAFDSGWDLLSPSPFNYDDFKEITHIWFSHEHPDHFSPPTLKGIPQNDRQRIITLYQKTRDQKVIAHCKMLGFPVRELRAKWTRISPSMEILIVPHGQGDSWLAATVDGKVLLNLNDCVADTAKDLQAIREKTGPIDVLFTQFSYAQWSVNRRKDADDILQRLALQCKQLAPKYIVPSASFIWWCHEENRHYNDEINRVRAAVERVTAATNSIPIVLYPGDLWPVGSPWDNCENMARYDTDYDSIHTRPVISSTSVPFDELAVRAKGFVKRAIKSNGRRYLQTLRPCKIFVSDLNLACRFDIQSGLVTTPSVPASSCEISLSSSALHYCFKFPWGGGTLMVNGRFKPSNNANELNNFFEWLWLAFRNNQGQRSGTWTLIQKTGRWYAGKIGLVGNFKDTNTCAL